MKPEKIEIIYLETLKDEILEALAKFIEDLSKGGKKVANFGGNLTFGRKK